jgi:hypothetical protein
MKLVSEQVKILLERMDMHPEEFVPVLGRYYLPSGKQDAWNRILNNGQFSLVEKLLIKRKFNAIRRAATQADILETIVRNDSPEGESEEEAGLPYMTINAARERFRISADGSVGIGSGT